MEHIKILQFHFKILKLKSQEFYTKESKSDGNYSKDTS